MNRGRLLSVQGHYDALSCIEQMNMYNILLSDDKRANIKCMRANRSKNQPFYHRIDDGAAG